MNMHELKTISPYFEQMWRRTKTAELRYNDRDFMKGDKVIFVWYFDKDNTDIANEQASKLWDGCYITAIISEVTKYQVALNPGFVMLSLKDLVNYSTSIDGILKRMETTT